jgi:hypothetical protein
LKDPEPADIRLEQSDSDEANCTQSAILINIKELILYSVLSREDRMRPVYRLSQCVNLFMMVSVIIGLTGCTGDLWNRISDLEQQMATMSADHRVLPQQMETLQLKVQTMDLEIRSRQSRVLAEIEHFRNEDLAHFTQRLETLAQNFQSFRKEMVSSAPWEQMHAEVADVQAALSRMKFSLDQIQVQQEQSHSPIAKRPTANNKTLSATETKAASATKTP